MTQSDLQKLSKEATGGTWRTLLYPINMYGMELADIEEVANGGPAEEGGDYCGALSPADAAFIVALVNAFREGRLVEAPTDREPEPCDHDYGLSPDIDCGHGDCTRRLAARSEAGPQ